MSKADEMFEKLGYKKIIKTIEKGKLIDTEYKEDDYSIDFREITKKVFLSGVRAIGIEELQAINEKVKELGWL